MNQVKIKIKSTKGFTLVELMITLAMMAIAVTAISMVIMTTTNTYQKSADLSNAIISNTALESVLREELQYAANIQLPDQNHIQYDSQRYGNGCTLMIMNEGEEGYTADLKGLPVIKCGNKYYPLLYRQHLNDKFISLQFTLNSTGDVLTVDVDNSSTRIQLVMNLLNQI